MIESTEQKILQKNLAQFIVKDVFNTITEDDILKVVAPGVWEHRGVRMTPGQITAIKNQALSFKEGIWKILKTELTWLAHQTGYVKSKTESDQIAGKMLEYLTDVIDTRIENMLKN